MSEHRLEVADVFRTYGDDFLALWERVLSRPQRKAFDDIRDCRTAALGGHVEYYDCGHCAISYNSCRNRSCPKCQGAARAQWLADREAELLPVEYFHVVFTLPQQIARLALQNARRIYSILFRAVAETLLTIAADPQHLGAAIGFLAVLHSWGQNLHLHPHIHCVVPGGGISPDNSRWIPCRRYRKSFFLPGKVLSRFFRKRFLIHLRRAFQKGKLQFHGELESLAQPVAFEALCQKAGRVEWVVYAKRPFGGPEQVLKYLARYTHRVAISNRRLLSMEDGRVTFEWKDYADWQPDQDDDLGRGRVHSSFSPSRAALRLCSHPSLWIPGQPQTEGKAGAVPVLAGCLASCQRSQRRFPGQPRFSLRGTGPADARFARPAG